MKAFNQLSDKEIVEVIAYFKSINWDENPFLAKKTYPSDMPDYPYAVCMCYKFNEKGEVYDMEAKNRETFMSSNLPPIPSIKLDVRYDLIRLEKFIKENGNLW